LHFVTNLIAIGLALMVTAYVSQEGVDLRKAAGETRRVCGIVVAYESLGEDGSGDCGTKFYIGETERKPAYYFVIPHAAGTRFRAPVRNALPSHRVCVTGEIATDKKRVPHSVIVAPSQVEMPEATSGPPFGSGAHHLCEAGMVRPRLRKEVKPSYPSAEFVRLRIEDVVSLDAVIAADGRVGDVRVTDGRYAAFNKAAVEALRRWQFHPATLAGQPVSVLAQVQITFTLR
jgi:TonB family protein